MCPYWLKKNPKKTGDPNKNINVDALNINTKVI